MKIFISPSNQPGNMYNGVKISEKANCEAIAIMVKAEMDKYEVSTRLAGFSTWYGNRPEEAKSFGADLVVCIHTNAGGNKTGSGAVVFYNNARTQAVALKLVDALNAIAPLKSNRAVPTENKVGELAEVTEPNGYGMDVLYIEINFHDNSKIAPWLVSARDIISKTISDTIMAAYKISKLKAEVKPAPVPDQAIKPLSGTLKIIYAGSDGVNARTSPSFDKNASVIVTKGEVFTVTGISVDGRFYRIKSGLYISSSVGLVKFTEAQTFNDYLVKVNADVLNIRESSSANSKDVGNVFKNQVYTIVEEHNGFGKLKSGAGWIALSYTNKI